MSAAAVASQNSRQELIGLEYNAASSTAASGAPIDSHVVRRRIDELRNAEPGEINERLATAASRAQPTHVLKVCLAWQGGLANTGERPRCDCGGSF